MNEVISKFRPVYKPPVPGQRIIVKNDAGYTENGQVLAVREHGKDCWTEVDVVMDRYDLNGMSGHRTFYWPAYEAALAGVEE
jgi:hypothetical protein